MGKIERFEDIKAWQKARILVREIYKVSNAGGATSAEEFIHNFALKGQMRKSAISVVSNIAEGFARETDKEFIRFLYIAHASIAELEAQLYVALDIGYIKKEEFDLLYTHCHETSKMIMGLIKYLRRG